MIQARPRSCIGNESGLSGSTISMASLALVLLVSLPAFGEDSWVGKRVIQKDRDFALKVGSKVIDQGDRMDVYRVEQVQGPWLWVKSDQSNLHGWAKADAVIPLDQAISFFTGAIHVKHDDPLPYVLRARVWEAKKELDIALGDLDEAVRFDPTHAWVYNWRGILWRERQDYDKALADHTEAIKLEPHNPHSYVNRALVFMDTKEYLKAVEDLNQAIRFTPENGTLFNKRGWAWHCMESFDKAISDYTQAIGLDPQLVDAYVNRGMAWFAKKEEDKAIADYSHALELDPSDPFAYNDRGWAWQSKGDYDKALADFNQALQFRPKFVRAYTNRGIVWASKKDFDKAVSDFTHAIELDPKRSRPYTNRGIALTAKGEFHRAIADFDHALSLDPDAIWPRFNRLVALLSSNPQDAYVEAGKLLSDKGWNNELAIHTALIGHFAARRTRQPVEARRFLADAAARSDSNRWPYQVIRFLLGEIREEDLLSMAGDSSQKTEIHSFLGLHYSLSDLPEKALPHFQWVKDKGVANNAEYRLALAELSRIEGRTHDGSSTQPPAGHSGSTSRSARAGADRTSM